MLLQIGAMDVLGDGLMRRWLAGEDEATAGRLDGRDDGLAGKQIVAEKDRPKVSDRGGVPCQPAFRRVAFAILLHRPILRRDEFGRQWQDMLVAWRDHAGAEEGVEVFRAAVRPQACRALPAFDLARAEVLGSVQRDQHSPVQALEWRQRPRSLDRAEEQLIERRRRGAVQHQADVVVGGDRRHAEQRLAVRSAVPFRQRPLMRQERRASHEEDRECRQADVGHRIVVVTAWSRALVRKTGADLAQLAYQFLNGAHSATESTIESRHKPKTTRCCGK